MDATGAISVHGQWQGCEWEGSMKGALWIWVGLWLLAMSGWAFQEPVGSAHQSVLPPANTEELAQEEMLHRSMALLPSLAKVAVVVRGATVLLQGEVVSPEASEIAEALVKATLPNRYMINRVQIIDEARTADSVAGDLSNQTDQDLLIQERLETIFQNVPMLKGIHVSVASGVVQLTGQAISVEAAEEAEALATNIAGVVFVGNEVQVSRQVERRLAPVIDNTVSQLRHLWMSLPLVLVALLVIVIFGLIGKWAMRWGRLYRMVDSQPLIKGILQQVIFLGFLLIGIILALDLLNARRLVTTLFGAAGIVGLALGFALKDIAENYLASLLLALRRPFTAKDFVKIGQYEGKVIRLNMRDTVLMTSSGNHLRIPNASVFKSVIINFTRNPMRRFQFEVGVGVNEDLLQVQEIGVATLMNTPGVAADPKIFSMVKTLADSSVTLAFFAWVDQSQFGYAKVKSEAIRLLKEALDEAGIEMPVPSYQFDVHQQVATASDPKKADAKIERHRRKPVDVRPDDDLDRQIAKDRMATDETNLLDINPT